MGKKEKKKDNPTKIIFLYGGTKRKRKEKKKERLIKSLLMPSITMYIECVGKTSINPKNVRNSRATM